MKKVYKKRVNNKIFKKTKKNPHNVKIKNLNNKEISNNDKRSFLKIYWSLLKMKHIILFTFFNRNDYNIIYIKLERFIFSIVTYLALNVFFFADGTMHKVFLDYGKYNFLQQIPQIIYSTLVSQLIDIIVCYLGLTEKYYYEIIKIKQKLKYNRMIKCIKIKIIMFFIFTFLMFVFFWYTIACFCSIYQNTQIIFIKDSFSSFALGLIYPFFLYLALALFKLILTNRNKK